VAQAGKEEKTMTINKEQRLFVFEDGNGYSCLGFDVLHRKGEKLAQELNQHWKHRRGSKAAYRHYGRLVNQAKRRFEVSGVRSSSDLTPQLCGLEGRRVEVIGKSGERRRFQVGRSTGWIPCHLEIARRNCSGGSAVWDAPFQKVTIIN
jgi:hypothetical protein